VSDVWGPKASEKVPERSCNPGRTAAEKVVENSTLEGFEGAAGGVGEAGLSVATAVPRLSAENTGQSSILGEGLESFIA
jgi:hypothetical protein